MAATHFKVQMSSGLGTLTLKVYNYGQKFITFDSPVVGYNYAQMTQQDTTNSLTFYYCGLHTTIMG